MAIAIGEPIDSQRHEAADTVASPNVAGGLIVEVTRTGYERCDLSHAKIVVRRALVIVATSTSAVS